MKTIKKIWLVSLAVGVLLTGCGRQAAVTQKEVQFMQIDLHKFRTLHSEDVKGVLFVLGDIPQDDPGCTLFSVGKKEFLRQIAVRNPYGEAITASIENPNLLKKLTSFEAWEAPFWGFGVSLVYLVEEEDEIIGYSVSFGESDGVIQGHYWQSAELKDTLRETLQRQGINWEDFKLLVDYKIINDLPEFRRSPAAKHVQAVLVVQGDIVSNDHVVLLAVGNEQLLRWMPLKHFQREPIDDSGLLERLTWFEFEENRALPVFGTSLVYIVKTDNRYVGYVLPFGACEGTTQGQDWHSEKLLNILYEISDNQEIDWQTCNKKAQ